MRYPHVQPGQPIKPPASMVNGVIDMLGRQVGPGVGQGEGSPGNNPYFTMLGFNPGLVYIPAMGVARATDSSIDPSEELGRFLTSPSLALEAASEANADAPLVIATNRINAGKTGSVAVAGVIQTRIEVTDESHQFAKPSTSTAWQLDSASSGLPVLFKEAGLGTKWAIVSLTEAVSSGSGIIPAIVTANTATTNSFEFQYTLKRAGATGAKSSDWTEGEVLTPAFNTAERIAFDNFAPAPVSNGVGVLAVDIDGAYYFSLAPIEGSCA